MTCSRGCLMVFLQLVALSYNKAVGANFDGVDIKFGDSLWAIFATNFVWIISDNKLDNMRSVFKICGEH